MIKKFTKVKEDYLSSYNETKYQVEIKLENWEYDKNSNRNNNFFNINILFFNNKQNIFLNYDYCWKKIKLDYNRNKWKLNNVLKFYFFINEKDINELYVLFEININNEENGVIIFEEFKVDKNNYEVDCLNLNLLEIKKNISSLNTSNKKRNLVTTFSVNIDKYEEKNLPLYQISNIKYIKIKNNDWINIVFDILELKYKNKNLNPICDIFIKNKNMITFIKTIKNTRFNENLEYLEDDDKIILLFYWETANNKKFNLKINLDYIGYLTLNKNLKKKENYEKNLIESKNLLKIKYKAFINENDNNLVKNNNNNFNSGFGGLSIGLDSNKNNIILTKLINEVEELKSEQKRKDNEINEYKELLNKFIQSFSGKGNFNAAISNNLNGLTIMNSTINNKGNVISSDQQLIKDIRREYLDLNNQIVQIRFSKIKFSLQVDNPPNEIFFKLKFYDFNEIKTNKITYMNILNNNYNNLNEIDLSLVNINFKNKGEGKKDITIKYEININSKNSPEYYHKNFINYLYKKQLYIELWNSKEYFLIGTCNLPLKFLLRQGKEKEFKENNLIIYDSNYNILGNLYVYCENSKQIWSNNNKFNNKKNIKKFKDENILSKTQELNVKKKNLIKNKINLTNTNLNIYDTNSLNEKNRLEFRVNRFKKNKVAVNNDNFATITNNYEREKIKHEKIKQSILQTYENNFKQTLFIGESKYINYKFEATNYYNNALYNINVQAIDNSDIICWWITKEIEQDIGFKNLDINSDINNFNHNGQLICNKQDNNLIFKLFYNDFKELENNIIKNYIEISNNNGDIIDKFIIEVELFNFPVDRIFKIFKLENQIVTININDIDLENNNDHKENVYTENIQPYIFCTNSNVNHSINSSNIDIKFKTPKGGYTEIFNVIIYSNGFRNEILHNYKIDCLSLKGIDICIESGLMNQKSISYFSNKSKNCRVYTSNKNIDFFDEFKTEFKVDSNKEKNINFNIKTLEFDKTECLINLVDISSNEILMTYYINIIPSKPKNIKNIKEIINENSSRIITIDYVNRTNSNLWFHIFTNRNNLLLVKDQNIHLKPNQKEIIRFQALINNFKSNEEEVIIYINDEEGYTNDCYILLIEKDY